MKKILSQGLRKYIRRQKLIIKNTAKNQEEENHLVKALVQRFYNNKTKGI